jgi:hypothetical protein
MLSHCAQRLLWRLRRSGLLPARLPREIDLAAWAPPDTRAAKEAEAFLRAVSSPEMIGHSLRLYYFSAIAYELSEEKPPLDREVLFVASAMHDVGLFEKDPPASEGCFTVGCAREARRIATAAGWDVERQDRMATAITSNLNPSVPIANFGVEAHFMSRGGSVEVLAEEWKLHPANLAEILKRHPREGLAANAIPLVAREKKRHPHCRFCTLDPAFSLMLRRSIFTLEKPPS